MAQGQYNVTVPPIADTKLMHLQIDSGGNLKVNNSGTSTGLTDTQLRATAVPVSGPLTNTQLRATPVPVKTLLTPGTNYTLTTTNASQDTALTVATKSITIYARNSDAFIQLGSGVQTASSTSTFIAIGERLNFDISSIATPHLAYIFGPTAAAAILHVTELN